MRYLADLHVHSPFALATSRDATLPGLAAWAAIKGLSLIGTGDFTHPGRLQEIHQQLVPAEAGFYRLRQPPGFPALPGLLQRSAPVRFLLSAEISCVYRKNGRVRKVHCLLLTPELAAVEGFNRRLGAFGRLDADGRPTLALDAHDLLELALESLPGSILVPAHIWTPWYSLFGAKSGFNSVEECFGDLSGQIFALETGLSSDPALNRRWSALDRYTLISNSDCHSPSKLGREANILETGFDYPSLAAALRHPQQGFSGTLELFPEEGKYFADGHRRCQTHRDSADPQAAGQTCPVCGRPLTMGVNRRVQELADRSEPLPAGDGPTAHHLVPLLELLAEINGKGPNSKAVRAQYVAAINQLGPELPLLLEQPLHEISGFSPALATAVALVRNGEVQRECGFDGQPGRILTCPREK